MSLGLQGKKVLVTGADGFIGSHLTERLVADGADVTAFVHYQINGSWGWLDEAPAEVREAVHVVAGDVRDAGFVERAVADNDVVFHLAALIGIPYSYAAPQSYVDTNITGTLNVLQAARRSGARVVHTSTSEVYGSPDTVPITEDHALKGQSPYSATKIGADKIAESFFTSFDLPVVVLRPFNTFGPRQSTRAVIPTVIAQALAGVQEIKLGSLWPRRDFTFVADTVAGFVAAGTRKEAVGRTVHLGTGTDIPIGELAELILKLTGSDAEIVTDSVRERPQGSEVDRLLSDPSLAAEVLQWKPTVTLADGLARTIEWAKDRAPAARPQEYAV